MNDVPIIDDPADITAEWLTDALGVAGARVRSFTSQRVGTGLVGQNIKFVLDWEGDVPDGAPASVVGKFASPDPTSRATGVTLRNYEREVLFYRHIKPTVHIRTPECHVAEWDPETNEFTLLLEDLAPAEQGDQVTGCTVDEAAIAMAELARLHAPRWDDPTLHDIDWLSRRSDESAAQTQMLYQMVWPGFVERYGSRLEPEALALAERFGSQVGAWISLWDGPLAVTHGDYRLDNMLFGTAEGGYPLAVVDWQTPGHGAAAADASYFMGAGLPIDLRRRHEDELLRRYHDELRSEGVTDWSWDDCREAYRLFTFAGVVMAVVASMVVGADERGEAMFTAMASRHCAHALDLKAEALLPA